MDYAVSEWYNAPGAITRHSNEGNGLSLVHIRSSTRRKYESLRQLKVVRGLNSFPVWFHVLKIENLTLMHFFWKFFYYLCQLSRWIHANYLILKVFYFLNQLTNLELFVRIWSVNSKFAEEEIREWWEKLDISMLVLLKRYHRRERYYGVEVIIYSMEGNRICETSNWMQNASGGQKVFFDCTSNTISTLLLMTLWYWPIRQLPSFLKPKLPRLWIP